MRPYKMAEERENIRRGVMQMKRVPGSIVRQPTVYHVDFTPDEVAQMVVHLNKLHQYTRPLTLEGLRPYIFENAPISMIVGDQVPRRTAEDVRRFCSDILAGRAAHPDRLRVLSFGPEDSSAAPKASDDNDDDDDVEYKEGSHMSALLLAREYSGNAGFGRMRRYANFQSDLPRCIEDDLRVVAEFTNCAGDIATISWVSDADMVCGTTTHSDSHNQQYNKPGNLLLGSLAAGRLQAYPDHCIPRPLVAKGDNATEAMRQSQDQWLYSSVVSSDYDPVHRRAYTSSFDGTVKVWKVEDDDDAVARGKPRGKHMTLLATWRHDGNVNFVVAAKDGSGRVATAADTPTQAVRIYTVDPGEEADIEASPYTALSCSRHDADGTDKWAYHPAALRWGPAEGTQHILAVGYSPRAATGDDVDIPEEKRNSGEIVLWDARAGRTIPLTNVTTANVFEIAWHPTLPRFVCATSPCGSNMAHGTRTQIHVFQRDPTRPGQDVAADPPAFCGIQALDCAAKDVNELTYVPNSPWHAYVTAGCTDGRVYVWDTARPDAPLHVLRHGASLDGHAGPDREDRDTGVKMTAWAASFDRLYTGSSDGVVKVWNVRHPTRPLVRVLLEAPAPISAGAFSPDGSRLAVGDATGRVFFLSPNKADEPVSHAALLPSLPGMPLRPRRRRPVPYTPHKEPPPPHSPTGDDTSNDSTAAADDSAAAYARRTYLSTSRLVPTGIPTIGVVQGPAYPTTGPFCLEAHASEDPSAPLLPSWQRQQRHSAAVDAGSAPRALRRLAVVRRGTTADKARHRTNRQRDLRVKDMARDEVERLARDGALLSLEGEEEWAFGPGDEEEW